MLIWKPPPFSCSALAAAARLCTWQSEAGSRHTPACLPGTASAELEVMPMSIVCLCFSLGHHGSARIQVTQKKHLSCDHIQILLGRALCHLVAAGKIGVNASKQKGREERE